MPYRMTVAPGAMAASAARVIGAKFTKATSAPASPVTVSRSSRQSSKVKRASCAFATDSSAEAPLNAWSVTTTRFL